MIARIVSLTTSAPARHLMRAWATEHPEATWRQRYAVACALSRALRDHGRLEKSDVDLIAHEVVRGEG